MGVKKKAPQPATLRVDPRNRIVDVRRVRASELTPHPGNWRQHPLGQAEALAGTMREVGDVGVLLAWVSERNGGKLTLIDGHLRRGLAPEHEYMVAITDLSDAEADYVLATHDPLAALAEADASALDALLASVKTDEAAVMKMLSDLAKEAGVGGGGGDVDAEARLDIAAELQQKWGTATGQIWALGEHRVMCGDATIAADVARLLGGDKPELMVTDPPYGVEYDPTWRAEAGVNHNTGKMGAVENDSRSDWTDAWRLFPGDVAYVYHAGIHTDVVKASLESAGFEARGQLIWNKDRLVLGRGDYHWKHEPIWYVARAGRPTRRTDDRTQTTVWDIPARDDAGHGHGTQKPVECMARPMRNHEFRLVYEPFLGSGTTVIAAQQEGCRCLAMELAPKYVAVALERWQAATGGTPVLTNPDA